MGSLVLFLLRVYVAFVACFFLYCLVVVPSSSQQLQRARTGRQGLTQRGKRKRRRPDDPWVKYLKDEPAGRLAEQLPLNAGWYSEPDEDEVDRKKEE